MRANNRLLRQLECDSLCHRRNKESLVIEAVLRHICWTPLQSPYSLQPLLRMARISLFSIVLLSLFFVASATPSEPQLAYSDGSVHTTQGWSWTDCGQSFV